MSRKQIRRDSTNHNSVISACEKSGTWSTWILALQCLAQLPEDALLGSNSFWSCAKFLWHSWSIIFTRFGIVGDATKFRSTIDWLTLFFSDSIGTRRNKSTLPVQALKQQQGWFLMSSPTMRASVLVRRLEQLGQQDAQSSQPALRSEIFIFPIKIHHWASR